MLSEVSRTGEYKYHVISLIYGLSKTKKVTHIKQIAHRHREQTGACQRGGRGDMGEIGEGDQEVQSSSYKISHGDVIYSIGI